MKGLVSILTGVLGVVLLPVMVQAQTLDETLLSAFETNPTLAAQRERLKQSREGWNQARSAILPSISTEVSVTDREDWGRRSGGGIANYKVSLTQPVFAGGAIQAGMKGATAQFYAGLEALRAVEQSVFVTAITAHADVVRDQKILSIRSNNVGLLSEQLRAARDRFEVGEITRTDVAQAEARLSASRAQLALTQANLAASRAGYLRVTGIEAVQPEALSVGSGLPDTYTQAIERALSNNPDLLQAQFNEQSADAAVIAAKARNRPNVNLSASTGGTESVEFPGNDRVGNISVTARLTMPIFTGGLNQSRVRSAKSQANETRLGTLAIQRQITETVSSAWNFYLSTQAVIESSRQAVRANEIAFDGVQQEAFVGLRTTLDVLNAEQELLNARLELARAQRDLVIASYALRQVMGTLHAAELGFKEPYFLNESVERKTILRKIDLTPWN